MLFRSLQDALHDVESLLGRTRSADRYAPRTIDLDLVVYDELVCDDADLTLPGSDLDRWFVAAGLAELAPGLTVPGRQESAVELAARLAPPDAADHALPEVTAHLRQRITAPGP